MSYLINNQQKLNDIIFTGRNKNYGAYAIRSSYGNTLLKSLLIVTGTFVGLMLTAYLLCRPAPATVVPEQLDPNLIIDLITPVDLKPAERPVPPAPGSAAPRQPNTSTNVAPVIVDSTASTTPPQDSVNTEPSVATNNSTNTSGNTMPGAGGSETGTGTATGGTEGGTSPLPVAEAYQVDELPEFEGGMAALKRFISQNVRYPGAAADIGHQGVVKIKFVVDEKGKVGSLKLLNNSGYGLDEEAMRVIGMLPNFKKPAKVNGHPVKVYFMLPISFVLK